MLAVTDRAKAMLKETLSESTDKPGIALRLKRDEELGKLSIMLDIEREGDQVIDHEELKVLLVDTDLSFEMEGISLDFNENVEGSGWVLVPVGE